MVQVVGGHMKYKVVFEDNHILVINKEVGMLSQADISQVEDVLSYYKEYLKNKYNKPGNVYLGLVHRLDRNVGGLMVLAKTSKAASRLSEQVRTHKLKKYYLAITTNQPSIGYYKDYLYKNNNENKSYISNKNQGKLAELEVIDYIQTNNFYCSLIALFTGRHHQIRVQFASRKTPLYGDLKYNKDTKKDQQIALYACGLSFYHPITKAQLFFNSFSNNYPFNLFEKNQLSLINSLNKYHNHVDTI